MAAFNIFLDDATLGMIKQFGGWDTTLANELGSALDQGIQLFQSSAQGAMHWQNPTGQLESSFQWFSPNRYTRITSPDTPYDRRRNEGFSGMTDSLGRFYANDPGAFFMDTGFDTAKPAVQLLCVLAVASALTKLGGTP